MCLFDIHFPKGLQSQNLNYVFARCWRDSKSGIFERWLQWITAKLFSDEYIYYINSHKHYKMLYHNNNNAFHVTARGSCFGTWRHFGVCIFHHPERVVKAKISQIKNNKDNNVVAKFYFCPVHYYSQQFYCFCLVSSWRWKTKYFFTDLLSVFFLM